MRNWTRDEGRSFEVGNQVLISSHRKLLSSKAMVVPSPYPQWSHCGLKIGARPCRRFVRKSSRSLRGADT
jgi:hypothetical protein